MVRMEGPWFGPKVSSSEAVDEASETVGGPSEGVGEASEAAVYGSEAVGGASEAVGGRSEGKVCGSEAVGGPSGAAGGTWEAGGGWVFNHHASLVTSDANSWIPDSG